ncbi:MAG: AMP-binding protein [Pseudomonadota bacterium]
MTNQPPLLPRISDYVAWHASRQPAATALILDNESWSWARLSADVEQLARALLAAGVRKGDRVATLQPPHPRYLVDFLATASIGAIWVGLNPRYQRGELAHVLLDSEPAVLLARRFIGDRDFTEDLLALADLCPSLHHLVMVGCDEPAPAPAQLLDSFLSLGESVADDALVGARAGCGDRDPCLIVYTSGSTGEPKGALLHHDGLARFSLGQNLVWPLDPVRAINYFPINHVGCVADCTLPCVVAGGTLIFMEQFEPADCLRLMEAHGVTLWGSVPSTFPMMIDHPDFARRDLSSVQLIAWGGAAMDEATIRRLRATCSRLATNYGMTETTSAMTAIAPTDDVDRLAHSVGAAFPGVEIRLAGEDGDPVADGEVGEVQTRSALNFLGYWRRPEATHDAFTHDGFFRTGDLAALRPDGAYRIAGRIKDMYKSGGYNVYPREVEAALEAHPSVSAAAVVAVPDPVWQEIGIAYVTLSAEAGVADILAFLRTRLANYKLPKRILIEPELPLLPIGKVDKPALRRRAETLEASGTAWDR